jgi:hypothetical protein
MANYEQPFEDTQALFDEAINAADLSRFVTIRVLTNNKAKELFKVNKANDLVKYLSHDDVIIIINEGLFEGLTDDQKRIVVDEAIAYISYDMENDKLIITKPDFIAHSGVLRKYGFEALEVVRESVKTLAQAQRQTDDETEQITN